ECVESSGTESTSPYRPVRNVLSLLPPMAAVTKTRSPHTTGLEFATPGRGVFQRTPVPATASQVVGAPWPSPMPDAPGPRKEGQSSGGLRSGSPAVLLATGAAAAEAAGDADAALEAAVRPKNCAAAPRWIRK